MSITPNKEILLKEAQILNIEYTIIGICGNCGKPFAESNVLNELNEDNLTTFITCPHCDYNNKIKNLTYN